MATITDLYQQLFGKDHIRDGDVIGFNEHGRAGGLDSGQGFKVVKKVDEAALIDDTGTDVYIGVVAPGSTSDTSSNVWQIKKISTSGTVTTINYADGDDNYNNIWDNRVSLSYS